MTTSSVDNLTINETPLLWWGGCIDCCRYPCICGKENYGRNYPAIMCTISSSEGVGNSFMISSTSPYSFASVEVRIL